MRSRPPAARHAAGLFAVCGLLALVAVPAPGAAVLPLLAVAGADLAVAALTWYLPWHRWRPGATLVLALPAFGIIGAANALGLVPTRGLSPLFVLAFVWVGVHHARWRSAWVAPFAAVSYVGSVHLDDHGVPLDARALVFVVVTCVLVAETVARAQERLRASEADMRFLAEHTADLVTRVGSDNVIRYSAPSLTSVLGWRPEEVVGRPTSDLRHPDDPDPVALAFASPGTPVRVERRLRRVDGSFAWMESVAKAAPGPDGRLEVLVSARDITQRREAEAEREHVATHDALTGLPNRVLLARRLEEELAGDVPLAVAFLDLDGFKAVNDVHGHHVGDRLLQQVARRLQRTTRDGDLVARYGGDEFVIALEGPLEPPMLRALAARVETELGRPYRLGSVTAQIGVSVGVAESEPGTTAEALVRQADAAMYAAKARRRSGPVPPRQRAALDLTR